MHKRTLKSGSCVVFFLLGVVGAYFVARAVLRRDAVSPVRIAGGSMAPALMGERFELTCEDCRFPFAVGAESPPDRDLATCPNCGFQEIDVAGLQPVRGQRVRIDRTDWRADAPRRWDVVAMRRNEQPESLAVKRVVGLPGERVAIRGGEIYVDGQIRRKPLDVFRRMAVLVHDNNHDPTSELVPRWACDLPGEWVVCWDDGGAGFRRVVVPTDDATPGIGWLVYQHRPGLPPPSRRVSAAPVLDHLGYNQAASRPLNEVQDLMLQFNVVPCGAGTLALRYNNGRHRWEARLTSNAASSLEVTTHIYRVTLDCDHRDVGNAMTMLDVEKPNRVEFAHVDGQIFLTINGEVVVTHVDEDAARSATPPLQATKPFVIGATTHGVEVTHLQIYRDIYYLHPWGNSAEWRMDNRLAKDEIFVLGDNSAASIDSRNWTPHGVRVRNVLGYVRPLTGEE